MTPLRIGLVGYGFGGRYFHAPLLASAAECEFLGLVSTSTQRRDAFTGQFPGRAVFDSLEQLAAAGAEAVTISTPADTHTDLTEQALRLGLAVVCDKPFALDAPSARETVRLAEQLQRPLTVYQNRRWDSDFRTVQKALADGVLGDPVRFESRFERFAPDPGPPASGAGTLLDFGSHLVDQALVLFGPAGSVYAEMHAPTGGAALDDDVFVAIAHRGGVHSHLWGSWRQHAPGPRFRVTGSDASYIVVAPMDGQEDLLVAGHSPATYANWGVEPERRWGRVFRSEHADVLRSERGAWDLFYPAFAAAVRGEGPLPVDPWNAVATAEVLDAARESAATNQVMKM
ncbi:MAG TPA: Gfo/Idh/MocA family oxidoreductase [Solirubrobacteraceae bacterium]|nr:Gfo/Idh/MocA family oxidoreductase [Solirubrobacteraceae bacterium]